MHRKARVGIRDQPRLSLGANSRAVVALYAVAQVLAPLLFARRRGYVCRPIGSAINLFMAACCNIRALALDIAIGTMFDSGASGQHYS